MSSFGQTPAPPARLPPPRVPPAGKWPQRASPSLSTGLFIHKCLFAFFPLLPNLELSQAVCRVSLNSTSPHLGGLRKQTFIFPKAFLGLLSLSLLMVDNLNLSQHTDTTGCSRGNFKNDGISLGRSLVHSSCELLSWGGIGSRDSTMSWH